MNPFKIKILIFLFLLLVQITWAQSTVKIQGRIFDAVSMVPLVDANIKIVGTVSGATSDASGRFRFNDLPLDESFILQASYMGYHNQRSGMVLIRADQPAQVDFFLDPKIFWVDPLEVEATTEPDGVIRVIDRQQIEQSMAGNVGELLVSVSGIQIRSDGTSSTVSIRGSQSNQVLVMLDGVPLRDQMSGSVDLSTLPVSTLDHIEISTSDHYGGALAGIIRLFSREPEDKQLQSRSRMGSFGLHQESLQWSHGWGEADFILLYQNFEQQGNYPFEYQHVDQVIREERSNAQAEHRDYFAKLNWSGETTRLLFSAQRFSSQRGLPGQLFALTPYARAEKNRTIYKTTVEYLPPALRFKLWAHHTITGSNFQNLYERSEVPVRYRSIPPYWSESELLQSGGGIKINPQDQSAAWQILAELERQLDIKSGETTEDMEFTLESVNCLGACALGPVAVVDGEYHGQMNAGKAKKMITKLLLS